MDGWGLVRNQRIRSPRQCLFGDDCIVTDSSKRICILRFFLPKNAKLGHHNWNFYSRRMREFWGECPEDCGIVQHCPQISTKALGLPLCLALARLHFSHLQCRLQRLSFLDKGELGADQMLTRLGNVLMQPVGLYGNVLELGGGAV